MLKTALSVRANPELPPPEPDPPDAYLPTPEEIAIATAEIRKTWSPEEAALRQAVMPHELRGARFVAKHCQTCGRGFRGGSHRKYCRSCARERILKYQRMKGRRLRAERKAAGKAVAQ